MTKTLDVKKLDVVLGTDPANAATVAIVLEAYNPEEARRIAELLALELKDIIGLVDDGVDHSSFPNRVEEAIQQ